MFERFFSTSKVVFGAPHTFGWVRCSALDANDLEAWERPDGRKVRLPRRTTGADTRQSRPTDTATTGAGASHRLTPCWLFWLQRFLKPSQAVAQISSKTSSRGCHWADSLALRCTWMLFCRACGSVATKRDTILTSCIGSPMVISSDYRHSQRSWSDLLRTSSWRLLPLPRWQRTK